MQGAEDAGRRPLLAACQEVERQALRELRGRVVQVKLRPLDMLTRFGWIRLQRRRVQQDGGELLCAGQRIAGSMIDRVCEVALRHSRKHGVSPVIGVDNLRRDNSHQNTG